MTLIEAAYIVVIGLGAGMMGWVTCEIIIGVVQAYRRPRK